MEKHPKFDDTVFFSRKLAVYRIHKIPVGQFFSIYFLAVDDMNTFLPVVLEDDVYQGDYRSGWKLYRAFIRLPHDPNNSSKTRQYTLSFETVRANKMFVFVDGKEIYRKELTHRYLMSPINCEFSGEENGVVELRVLFHVNIENEDGCGLSKYIKLI